MKQRLDDYLDAMLKRGNKLEMALNAIWLIPLWLGLRLYTTITRGPVKL